MTEENIQKINIEDIAKEEFIPYAGQSLINFLPSIDGTLPVHRKIAISMLRNNRLPSNPFVKSVKAMGEIVTYYIYGTSGLYSSMVNMANNNMNIPMLYSKGSWGDKRRKDGYASAERYTDCKASDYLIDMMKGLKTKPFIPNVVPMKPNFDNTTDEMIVMPSLPPNILLNMSQSISLSEASKIPSFNVNETCDSIISYIQDNDIDKAIDIIKCPDFNFGGQIIYNKDNFRNIYKTGRGSFSLLGKYKFKQLAKEKLITIYEVPFNTTIDDIEDKLRLNYEKGLLKEVVDIHNGCGKDGIALDIYLKNNTNVDTFITKLRKYSPYESKFSCNFTILDLDWKTPRLMSLQNIFDKWIQHRVNCISNELKFDIEKFEKQLHLLKGLNLILLDIDKAIEIIKHSESDNEAIASLKAYFKLDDIQAENIANIKLINLNKNYIIKKTKDIDDLVIEIKQLQDKLNNKNKILNIIIEQLNYCKKKYGQPRRTTIISEEEIKDIPNDIEIEDSNVHITLTKDNYFKKTLATSLRGNTSQKLKDNDSILIELDSTNKSSVLFFTNKGNCYKKHLYEFDDTKLSNLGIYLKNELELEDDEIIIHAIITKDYKENLIVAFKNGKVAKISLSVYATKSNRTKLMNAINTNSPIVNIFTITKDIDILCQSSIDKVLVINTSYVNVKTSKFTQGVQILKSKNNSTMKLCVPLDNVGIDEIEDVEYYRAVRTGVGSYLKKTDNIKLI
jgi:DNA gyrase/topoisomerase IV subunit A